MPRKTVKDSPRTSASKALKLYLIEQDQNNGPSHYDSAVVAMPDEEAARNTNPMTGDPMTEADWWAKRSAWCNGPDHVTVSYLGVADPGVDRGIVCASFAPYS